MSLGIIILILNLITGYRSHIGQIFSVTAFDLSKRYSFVTVLANIINIVFNVIAQAFVVEKANKCLDFTLSVFIIQIICMWIFQGKFPWSFNFYLINTGIIFVTVLAAEYTCMRIE